MLIIDSTLNAPQDTIRLGLPPLGKVIGLALQVLLEQWEKCAAVFYTVVNLSWEPACGRKSLGKVAPPPTAGPLFTCGNIVPGLQWSLSPYSAGMTTLQVVATF